MGLDLRVLGHLRTGHGGHDLLGVTLFVKLCDDEIINNCEITSGKIKSPLPGRGFINSASKKKIHESRKKIQEFFFLQESSRIYF